MLVVSIQFIQVVDFILVSFLLSQTVLFILPLHILTLLLHLLRLFGQSLTGVLEGLDLRLHLVLALLGHQGFAHTVRNR